MKRQSQNPLILTLLITANIILLLSSASITAEEVEDEREFDYEIESEKGPQHWGYLKKEWADCKNGRLQSPIDLSDCRVKVIPKPMDLRKHYKSHNATLVNRGHDIEVKWEGDAGSILMNGTYFFLHQCHWHSPSEHTINGRRYDLELHMVHESPNPDGTSKIAVVGLLYRIGGPDPFLLKLAKHIMTMVDQKQEKNIGEIDPSEIKTDGKMNYKYIGSLTTPPCTEGVIWTINKEIRTVSREQVKLLREAVHDYAEMNARPLQALNQREIYLYGPNARINGPNI